MRCLKFAALFLGFGALLLLLNACGSDDGTAPTGTVRLALTDAVDHNFSEVVISIREVRAVPAGAKGENGLPLLVSYDTPKVVNVLDLAFQQELLGEAVLPAGKYNQLRLVLEKNTNPNSPANYVVLAGSEQKIPLDTPSGQQSGLKLVGGFTLEAGEIVTVVLDFDPARAIVETGQSGKWIFKPTGIRVVQTDDLLPQYGAIVGRVVDAGLSPVLDVAVLAVPAGSNLPIAAGPVNTEDGTFRLFLPEGDYELKAQAEGFEPFSSLPDLYQVVVGEDTTAGDIVLEPSL